MIPGLGDVLGSNETVALATLVVGKGSIPRSLGTKMAIRAGGRHLGTVGGGCSESEVIRAGLAVLDSGKPRVIRVELVEDVTEEAQAACGGTMEFVVAPWGSELLPIITVLQDAISERLGVRLVTCLDGNHLGAEIAIRQDGSFQAVGLPKDIAFALVRSLLNMEGGVQRASATKAPRPGASARRLDLAVDGDSHRVLVEELAPPPVLLICGGGHIALPLARLGKQLAFRVVVIDDRPSFANKGRFPEADEVICSGFRDALLGYPTDGQVHAVVVTRGHRYDYECVKVLIGRGLGYLGMIGSRRRAAGTLSLLREAGLPAEFLMQLHSPIGLDIGAESPEEIAVSILAEIILVMRGGTGRPMSLAQPPMPGHHS